MKKDIFLVFSTNFFKVFVSVLTLFIVPKVLPIEQYGYLKLFQFYAAYIGVTHLGFCDGVYLKLGGKKIEETDKQQLADAFSTLLFYEIIIATAMFLYGIIRYNFMIICLGLIVVPYIMSNLCNYIFQATGEFKIYAKVVNVTTLSNFFLYLVLILSGTVNYKFYVAAECILQYIVIIFNCYFMFQVDRLRIGRVSIKIFIDAVYTGFLLLLGNFVYSLFLGIDRWFISVSLSIEEFSKYSFAGQMVAVVNMVVAPIAMTLYSNMSKRKDRDFEKKIKKIILVCLMFIPELIYCIKVIVIYFLPNYTQAMQIVSVLLITQIFLCLNTAIFVNLYKTYKKQKEYFIRLVIALLIAVALDLLIYLLYPCLIGYAAATLVSCVVWLVLNVFYFKYMYFSKEELLYIILLFLCYILINNLNVYLQIILYIIIYLILTKCFMKTTWNYFVEQLKSQKLNDIHN